MIAIYARVSTEDQAKNGFSLADQVRDCRIKAGTSDVLTYVDEGVSGEFLDRPQLSRLRTDVRAGLIHQVICLDPDRLSRKLMNQLILSDEMEARAQLLFVNGDYARTPEGQLFYQMRGAISQFEKAKINERMSRGRREKARQGRVLRDFHIYGYDFDTEREQFVRNEREATIVKLIFDLFTNPQGRVKGINGIACYLNELGVPSKRGSVFHRQVIRQMLMNTSYIGEFHQNKWNTEGMLGNSYKEVDDRIRQSRRPREEWIALPIPAIIETQQFAFAQQLLEQSRRRWAGKPKHVYLLSGLLRCVTCGNTMVGMKRKNWGTEALIYSDEKSTAGAKHPGCKTRLICEEIDRQVWHAVVEWVGEPQDGECSLDLPEQRLAFEHLESQRLAKEIEGNQRIIDRLFNLLGDPAIEEQDIREKVKEMQLKKHVLQSQWLEVQERLQERTRSENNRDHASLLEAWQGCISESARQLTVRDKQNLLRTVVREVRVSEQGAVVEIVTL